MTYYRSFLVGKMYMNYLILDIETHDTNSFVVTLFNDTLVGGSWLHIIQSYEMRDINDFIMSGLKT